MTNTIRPRGAPIIPSRTALLIIDVQKGTAAREEDGNPYFYSLTNDVVVPNLVALRDAARAAGMEVIYTVIQSLTADGRDLCLDYKLTGFHFPPGSEAAQMVDALAPGPDEIVLPKTSSSVFNSTMLDYLLRNMGKDAVIVGGFLTDQCIDHAIRDGADRGYEMICAVDCCGTQTPARHEAALAAFSGYCRQVRSAELIAEMGGGGGEGGR
ncbi:MULTISPECIES: isochorismatase family cysteine hydrolase [Rhodomicrobium]|uniref:cysteine hydrolase family protein n=1 Tax=Rhodomicrobium TaxID=1068 RepID=UPI000B4BCCD9|nr:MULTISPECIES: isochorismatase family cysteine hydrolase [Rhodomicrobium]